MNLFDAFERYRCRRLIGKAETTEGKFRRAIRELALIVGHLPKLEDLTDDNLASVVAGLIEKGRSAETANDYRAKLCALWSFCAKRRWVDSFPDVDALPTEEHAPVGWLKEELPQVVEACRLARESICGIPGPLWFRSFVLVLWDSGERIGAILQAQHDQLRNGQLFVPARHRKGRTRDKFYPLRPGTLAAIEEMRTYHQGPNLVPRDFCRATLWNRWRSCLKRAGLPHDKKHMFHCVRRSVASHASAAGADATALLDHSSGTITKKGYIDPRIVPPPRAIDVLFPIHT